jgi:amidase
VDTDAALARVDATTDDALGTDDATALLRRLAEREVSSTELYEAALARARHVNPALNAVATWTQSYHPATRPIPAADAALAGVPTVVKDNEDLADFPSGQGSNAVPDRPAATSSPWVAQMLRLGLVPLAKTTLPEFGLTATTESVRYGATHNPWDVTRSSGGSSGGSAALVAAGAVPIAHANDGGGSIRIPAACCGLVGLKPTRGRLVDRPELERLPVQIAVQGVLTRSVRDTALYLAEAERLHHDARLPPVGHVTGPDPRRLRVGVVTSGILGLPLSAPTVAAVRDAAVLCERLGHHVEETGPPVDDQFGVDFLRYWAFVAFSLRYGGAAVFGRPFDGRRTEPFTRGLAGLFVRSPERLPPAVRRLRRLAREHERGFDRYDVLLSPVLGHETPPIGHLAPDVPFRVHLLRLLRYTSFTPLQNVTGSPAVSLPLGRTADGLPIGVQVVAPYGCEDRLLSLAYELEEAAPWPTRVGDLRTGSR